MNANTRIILRLAIEWSMLIMTVTMVIKLIG